MHNKEGICFGMLLHRPALLGSWMMILLRKQILLRVFNKQEMHTELGAVQDCASRLLFCRSTLTELHEPAPLDLSSASLFPCFLRFRLSLWVFLQGTDYSVGDGCVTDINGCTCEWRKKNGKNSSITSVHVRWILRKWNLAVPWLLKWGEKCLPDH